MRWVGERCATGATGSDVTACLLAVTTGSTADAGAEAAAGLGMGEGAAIGETDVDDTVLPIVATSSEASTGLASLAGGAGKDLRMICSSSAPSRLFFQGSLKPGRPKVWPPNVMLSNAT